jgi:alanine dehydrogenase
MERTSHQLTFGFPRMHKEAGERRDFLPPLIHTIADLGCAVSVEGGIGSGMGFVDRDYQRRPGVEVVDERTAYEQDVILVLRAPEGKFEYIRPGATLLSMLHFPTRPARVLELQRLGINAISLDTILDDEGRRLVVNGKAVAWNGLEAAFELLERTWPSMSDARRRPVHVTVMGAGDIGKHAIEAATKYGNLDRNMAYATRAMPGVEVVTIGRNLTSDVPYMHERLSATDVLVDATQRDDPARPILSNEEIRFLPQHAVICDLVVDPYLLDSYPPTVRGIEGIPQGSLDQYAFAIDDPAWDQLPPVIPTEHRRAVVSCYSWPGVHPAACMEHYGLQLESLLETLIGRGGCEGIRRDGTCSERALWRGSLAGWLATQPAIVAEGHVDLVPAGR